MASLLERYNNTVQKYGYIFEGENETRKIAMTAIIMVL